MDPKSRILCDLKIPRDYIGEMVDIILELGK